MSYIPMIDTETGEILSDLVTERAHLAASREWGGPDYPPRYHRQAMESVMERARSERLQWRQARGLPDDQPTSQFYSYAPSTNE